MGGEGEKNENDLLKIEKNENKSTKNNLNVCKEDEVENLDIKKPMDVKRLKLITRKFEDKFEKLRASK
jgi:hypothetical protein